MRQLLGHVRPVVRGCGALWGPTTLNPLESFVSHLQPSHVCVPCSAGTKTRMQSVPGRRAGRKAAVAAFLSLDAKSRVRRGSPDRRRFKCAPISADSPPRNPLSGLRFRQTSDEGFCCAAALHRLSIIPTAPSLSVNRVPKKASPFTSGGKQRLFNWPMRLCNPEPPLWVLARRRYLRNELTDSFLAPLCAGQIEASQARS